MSDDLRIQVARALAGLYAPKCCDECDMSRDIFAYRDYLEDADVVISAVRACYNQKKKLLDPHCPLPLPRCDECQKIADDNLREDLS